MNNNLETTTNVVAPTPPKKSGSKVIIAILLIAVIGMGGFITYDKVLKKKPEPQKCECEKCNCTKCKDNTDTTNTSNTSNTTNNDKELTKQKIFNMVKEKMIADNYAKSDQIEKWQLTKVVYAGYFEENPSEKYYNVSGVVKCKNNIPIVGDGYSLSDMCVYDPYAEIGDGTIEYNWNGSIIIKEKDGNYTAIGYVEVIPQSFGAPSFVKVFEELK